MNKILHHDIPFLLLLFSAVTVTATATAEGLPTWEPRASYGMGRHHPITFANETHGFLLTGTTLASPATSDVYIYEEATDEWTTLEAEIIPMAARSFGYGVVLPVSNHTKAYLGFGAALNGTRLQDLWEWDMVTLEWNRLADLPGPGRRHPSMVPVLAADNKWKIHVGLGDGYDGNDQFANFNDYWSYDIESNTWEQLPDFPGTPRHHPFYFGLGRNVSYAGLGHSSGRDPYIERDFYSYHTGSQEWVQETDFESYQINTTTPATTASEPVPVLVSTEARVAGAQFSIEFPLPGDTDDANSNNNGLIGALGFVVSGDGDDHSFMEEGEFHAFYPRNSPLVHWNTASTTASTTSVSASRQQQQPSADNSIAWWRQLPPHPGVSRWAPGSFVMRGTARAYFTSGYSRAEQILYDDLWRIDLSPLFRIPESEDVVNEGAVAETSSGSVSDSDNDVNAISSGENGGESSTAGNNEDEIDNEGDSSSTTPSAADFSASSSFGGGLLRLDYWLASVFLVRACIVSLF